MAICLLALPFSKPVEVSRIINSIHLYVYRVIRTFRTTTKARTMMREVTIATVRTDHPGDAHSGEGITMDHPGAAGFAVVTEGGSEGAIVGDTGKYCILLYRQSTVQIPLILH